MYFNVIVLVLGEDRAAFAILGPNNNYVEITVSTINEILNKQYKGNLNDFFLFQIDVKNEIKSLRKSSKSLVITEGTTSPFEDFIHNIPLIWKNTPPDIKIKYKLLSEEFEKSNKSTELVIRTFDPENLVRKSRKRELKENRTKHRKKKRYKEDTFTLKSKVEAEKEDNENVAFVESNNISTFPVVAEPSFYQAEDTSTISNYPQPDNTILKTSMDLPFELYNFFSVPEHFVYPFSSENFDPNIEFFADAQDSIAFGPP